MMSGLISFTELGTRDMHETFQAETETRPETHEFETQTRPRR